MTARLIKHPLIAGFAFVLTTMAAGAAAACCTPPPPCCRPPSPPTPPTPPCCSQVNIPGVTVNVGAVAIVNVNASAQAGAVAGAQSGGTVFVGGGGGGGWYAGPGSSGLIQGLNVEGAARAKRVAYEATRRKVRIVVIQAVCIDDKEIPHPASQVTPDRDIDDSYDGELYRCLAGTHMQITIANYDGKIDFDHGQIITCAKGEALYRSAATNEIACRPQKHERDCNERSLLRRFGAGVKIVRIVTIEHYTAYREETVQSAESSNFSMSIDGGVGGVVY